MGLNKYINDRTLLVDVQDKQHTHRAVAAQLCPPPPLGFSRGSSSVSHHNAKTVVKHTRCHCEK